MSIEVRKVQSSDLQDVQALLNEYYEALEIQKRDTPEDTRQFIASSALPGSRTGLWLAYRDEIPIGCVVLRELNAEEVTLARLDASARPAEVKRLFVRDEHRGQRVADRLLDAVEHFAKTEKITWIYLDSKDDLFAALKFYKRRGYAPCERYNTNPQATMFMRKQLKVS